MHQWVCTGGGGLIDSVSAFLGTQDLDEFSGDLCIIVDRQERDQHCSILCSRDHKETRVKCAEGVFHLVVYFSLSVLARYIPALIKGLELVDGLYENCAVSVFCDRLFWDIVWFYFAPLCRTDLILRRMGFAPVEIEQGSMVQEDASQLSI